MSLRAFHILFILTALAFQLFFAYWSGTRYLRADGAENLILAIVSGAAFAAGVPYLIWFIRKTRTLP